MTIKRRYAGLNWLGEKRFYSRFIHLEQLGFRRYRESKISYFNSGFWVVLPEGWTLETLPLPPLPARLVTLPFKTARRVAIRDQQSHKRVTLVELRADKDNRRRLADIWFDRYYSISWPSPEVWQIVDANDQVLHSIPHEPLSPEDDFHAADLCEIWLDTHYPNWRDPFAYWDD